MSSKVVKTSFHIDENDFSLAIGASKQKIEVFDAISLKGARVTF